MAYAAQEPVYFAIAALLVALATRTAAGVWPHRLPSLPVPFTGLRALLSTLRGFC